jgi:hypothetical protein
MEPEPKVQHIVYGDVDKSDESVSSNSEAEKEPDVVIQEKEILYAPSSSDEEGSGKKKIKKKGEKSGSPEEVTKVKALTADDVGGRWSKGSEYHHIGECKPCIWIWKPTGCSHGSLCEFCHACDQNELAKRRSEKDAKLRSEFRRKRAQMAAARERYDRGCYERWAAANSAHQMVPPGPAAYGPYGAGYPYGPPVQQPPPGAWMQGPMQGGMQGPMQGSYVDPRYPPQVPYGGRYDEGLGSQELGGQAPPPRRERKAPRPGTISL